MGKIKKYICTFTILFVFLVGGVSYATSPEQQAQIYAEENLLKYLEMVEPNYKDFHYETQNQVMKSCLGEPIKNFIISPQEFDENKDILEQAKPYPFYVFPVIVDGNVITDFTVVLIKGEWQVVDIGGHLSKIINDKSNEVGIDIKDNNILRYAGKTYVIINKDNKEIGYSPYLSEPSTGLEKEKLTTSDILKKTFAHQKDVLLKLKKQSSEPEVRGISSNQSYILSFDQNTNVFERIVKFVSHVYKYNC